MITIAQRIFGVPLLLQPSRAIELARFFSERHEFDMRAQDAGSPVPGREREYEVINGIAHLPMRRTVRHSHRDTSD